MTKTEPESAERPAVLWIGPRETAEFGPCCDVLTGTADVTTGSSVDMALSTLKTGRRFDLAVLACPRPIVETQPVEQLAEALAPTPVIQLLGTWCEGEGRTGRVVDGVERVFWHQFPLRLKTLIAHGDRASANEPRSLAVIHSHDAELARSLVDTLSNTTPAVWSPEATAVASPASVHLWDGGQLNGREADELHRLCGQASRTAIPVIAMLDFPRAETVEAATRIGASVVLGKPFTVDALLAAIDHSVTREERSMPACTTIGTPSEALPSLRDQLHAEREQELAREAA